MTPSEIATVLRDHAAWLRGAGGQLANLFGANLRRANLSDANLSDANLFGANLSDANLSDANLSWAKLTGAKLSKAKLTGANLSWANLSWAKLTGANLSGATMPDGRKWEDYRADHMAGICDTPEVRAKAEAAWGGHSWTNCPMHAALGICGLNQIDDDERRRLVACWVALYDGGCLPDPREDGAA